MIAPKIPLAALAKNASSGTKVGTQLTRNLRKLSIFTPEKTPKEEKIHVTTSYTDKSVTLHLSDMRITARLNGTKYERNTHNITVASDLQYANVILGHIISLMKVNPNMDAFIADLATITGSDISKDTDIKVSDISKWLKEKYSYVELDSDTINVADLFNMCEGYAKIAYDLSVKCGTAASIRIICNRLVPPAKKDKDEKSE